MSSYAKYSPAATGGGGGGGTVTSVTASAPLASSGGNTPNISLTGIVPVADGGTNSSTALNNNRVMISSGGAIVEEAAITASRALASDANGLPVASATTATELGFVSGVTSAIQTQLNGKQSTLTIGNLTDAGTDGIVVTGGTGSIIGSGTSLAQHVADTTHNGYLSSTDWNTFNGKQSTLTLGNLTDAGTDGITVTGGTGAVVGSGTSLSQHVSDSTHNGYLSSADWVRFNQASSLQQSIAASTATTTIDLSVAAGSLVTLTASTTLTLNNPTTGGSYLFEFIQDSTTRTVTWPAAVKWPGGTAPIISAASGAKDSVTLYWDGTIYLGNFSQAYS